MVIDQERKDELRKEGFTSGAEEIKEKHIERGKMDGKIEALQKMLVDSIENQFSDVEKKVREKIRFIDNEAFLRRMILSSYDTKYIEDIYKSIHKHLSDEDMYRREGYRYAIDNHRGFYEAGKEKGHLYEKLFMIILIFENRFGDLEKEIEAAILTRDLEERIDELFSMTFKIYDKQELINYISNTMTAANSLKAEGYILGCRSARLNNLIYNLFITQDRSIQDKIKRIRDIEEVDALIEKVKHAESLEEFISELDQSVKRSVNNKKSFMGITELQFDHLLQE